jgi:exodeoxyribonuclease V beta subunit
MSMPHDSMPHDSMPHESMPHGKAHGRDGDSGDLGLRLPLHGRRLIEASAGTGKTFTLITVLLRLLLVRGVPIAQLLAVTFTRAATAELRQRLRQRLRAAQRVLDDRHDPDDGEAQAAAAVLAQAQATVSSQDLRDRVRAALLQLDEALIATIHGFCQRALREFGFRAGAVNDLDVLDSAPDVWEEVAADLWRRAAGEAGDAAIHQLLRQLWKTPGALARDLPDLCDDTRMQRPQADESEAATALHALRADAVARFEAAMAARRARTQDQLLGAVWRASEDDAFVAALAKRWPLLLIDEFQDTDPRQWDLFRRIYAAADPQTRLLCLIGDPKQAIYRFRGGDLGTYLNAREHVRRQSAPDDPGEFALDANYRSRPALLRALEHLFAQNAEPFRDESIRFHPLRAAGSARDEDYAVDGVPSAALTLHWLPQAARDDDASAVSAAGKGMRKSEDERALMVDTAVAAIAEVLAHARLRGEPLKPSDIAVLTPRNKDARQMQQALAAAGLAASVTDSDSVYASEAAQGLDTVLRALAEPSDPGLFRAALATPLLGYDATAIAALDDDAQAFAQAADAFERAAMLWRSRGPLPALLPFATAAAQRWLGEQGGARRLTDTLHLLELLQADAPLHQGPVEQLRWFAQRCARPGDQDRAQLRLEADADAIQISTIHKAKGLEYAVVVLPFLAMDRYELPKKLKTVEAHDKQGHALRAWVAKDVLEPQDLDAIRSRADEEEAAEAQRLLYVALTRAKYAVHALWSRNAGTDGTAMHWLLHAGERTGRKNDTLDAAGMHARILALAAESGGDIVVRDAPETIDAAALARDVAAANALRTDRAHTTAPARRPRRRFAPETRLHSFSALHARSETAAGALSSVAWPSARPGADDEAVLHADDEDATLAGTAFGNAVHAVLEAADPAQWRLAPESARDTRAAEGRMRAPEDRCPPQQRALLERALLREGLDPNPAALAQTARMVHRALNARLPGGVRLCTLDPACMRSEMGFHFRLRGARSEALYALLDAHGYPRAQRLPPTTLDGMMQGYIDLVYRDAAGRHYVLDYKTNRLAAYDPASLRHAVMQCDYDLQYLIYLVALRRWLRLRHDAAFGGARGPGPAIGGAVYLFLRGMTLTDDDLNAYGPNEYSLSEYDLSALDLSEHDVNHGARRKTRMRASEDAPAQLSLLREDARAGVHIDPVSPALLAALDTMFDGADLRR